MMDSSLRSHAASQSVTTATLSYLESSAVSPTRLYRSVLGSNLSIANNGIAFAGVPAAVPFGEKTEKLHTLRGQDKWQHSSVPNTTIQYAEQAKRPGTEAQGMLCDTAHINSITAGGNVEENALDAPR